MTPDQLRQHFAHGISIYEDLRLFVDKVFGSLPEMTCGANPLMRMHIDHCLEYIGAGVDGMRQRAFLYVLRSSTEGFRGLSW